MKHFTSCSWTKVSPVVRVLRYSTALIIIISNIYLFKMEGVFVNFHYD